MLAWIDARKRHHLSHAQVQVARELGINPAKLGDAFVIGEPVSVVGIDDDGHTRCGLIAKCRRADASQHSRETRIVANALPMEVLR